MLKWHKIVIFILLITSSSFAVAEILVYPFADPVKEERFNQLIQELRCPKCQNNNLADSNAPLSVDLKDIIYEKINAGESDEQIVFYLKERYGDFISYLPPVKPSTWVIWYGPFVVLLIAGFLIFRFVAARQKLEPQAVGADTSESSRATLADWENEISEESSDNHRSKDDSQ